MDKKCESLDFELRKLTSEEVRSFHKCFNECQDRAYTWELWAAAYIIGGGCSDDAFSDFRATLISMGRETFEKTLADPQWLAEINYDAESAHYEGYQYVPTKVEEELGGGKIFCALPDELSQPGVHQLQWTKCAAPWPEEFR